MRTRQEYDRAFAIVRAAIAQWDPYILFGSGSPPDEFDGEIARLLPRIRDARAPSDVAVAIADVFGAAFEEPAFTATNCAAVGAIVYSGLESAGLLSR